MGAKKKGGKKKKGPKEEPEPDDRFMTMGGEELEITRSNLRERLQEAKINRNILQIEKDMIHDFYNNTREEIKELEAEILNFDTQMQKKEKDHDTEVISHLQKVQHHEYEHQEAIDSTKTSGNFSMNEEVKCHRDTEAKNRADKNQLKTEYTQMDYSNIATIDQKEKEHQQDIKFLQNELEENKKTLISTYEAKLEELRKELELRMKVEIHEIEERKNEHINQLMLNHESAFREMKEYYNDITRENLDLIKQLQTRYLDIKAQIANSETIVQQLIESGKILQEPLSEKRRERKNLLKYKVKYDKDLMGYRNAKGSLKDLEKRREDLKKEKVKLDEKYKKAEQEKQDMYRKFEIAVAQLQTKSNYKNEVLEQKLGVFQGELEKKEMTLKELVQRSGLDQGTVDNICKNMEEAIEAKNSILRNLKYSLAHATKAYNDAIRVYEAKLVEFGIPAEELGLEPLVTNTSTMPAGLVAA